MTLISKALGAYLRSGLRGGYRTTLFLANRLDQLQSLPVGTESGVIYIDLRVSAAHWILADPNCRTGENEVMKRCVSPGDMVYDIGANVGYYTNLLSQLAGDEGKIFAFEPNPGLHACLRRNANSRSNVAIHPIALGDSNGVIDLFVPEDESMASVADWTNGIVGEVHKVRCEIKRIDDLVEAGELPLPQFIKCDVEGAELSVFAGARKALDRDDAPVLLFECNALAAKAFGLEPADYIDYLEGMESPNYKFFIVEPKGVRPLTTKALDFANLLAIPAKRSKDILF